MSKIPTLDLGEVRSYIRQYSPVFVPMFEDKQRYHIIWGGAGSGKSHIVARKILLRLLEEKHVKHNFLVVRKIDRTIKRSVFALMKNPITKSGLF